MRGDRGGGEHLRRAGEIAQSSGQVDRCADVIVPVEDEDRPGADSASSCKGSRHRKSSDDLHGCRGRSSRIQRDKERPVTQPVRDPNAAPACRVAYNPTKPSHLFGGGDRTRVFAERGEPAEIHHRKRAFDERWNSAEVKELRVLTPGGHYAGGAAVDGSGRSGGCWCWVRERVHDANHRDWCQRSRNTAIRTG